MDFSKLGKLTNSPDENWDIVVIGSGHNGLLAAAYLAAAGKKVLVLERQAWPGGGVASLEMADKGYKSERHSAIHHLILANPLIKNDELRLQSHYGLEYIHLDILYAIVFEDGVLPIYQDRNRTKEGIAKLSIEDAKAYDRFMDEAVSVVHAIVPGMFEPPVDRSAQLAGTKVGEIIAKASTQSSYDIICSYFKNDTIQVALLRFVTEIQLAHPKNVNSGLMVYLGLGMAELYGVALPRGGGSNFTNSVIKCIRAHGGDIRLNSEVTKVVVENGRAVGVQTRRGVIRAKDAVIGMIHPHILSKFVDNIDSQVLADAKETQFSDYTLFVIHAALDNPLQFTAGPIANNAVMNTICVNSMDELLRAYDNIEAGKLPTDKVLLGASCVTTMDPSRAPPGKSVLHAVVMVKYDLADGGPAAWDNVKDDLAHTVFRYLARFAPNLTPENILSYEVVTPVDHERDSPSFQHGDICALSMRPSQLGVDRPTKALSNYRVPGVDRLYLAGPFMHPGGAVWGGGRATSKVIFSDLGLDFARLFENSGSRL